MRSFLSMLMVSFVLIVLSGCAMQEPAGPVTIDGVPIVNGSTEGCGDGECTLGEYHEFCPEDCPLTPWCGDGACDESESPADCPADCRLEEDECERGTRMCDADGFQLICVHDYDTGANVYARLTCAEHEVCDAGECVPVPWCGDGVCSEDEDCDTCAADCGVCPFCGDGTCDEHESCDDCAADCGVCPPVCGDDVCEGDEDCDTCAADCGVCPFCGDGTCNGDEGCDACPEDCGGCPVDCGDDVCGYGEFCENCPADCGVCLAFCGDGACDEDETTASCPADCSLSDDECERGTQRCEADGSYSFCTHDYEVGVNIWEHLYCPADLICDAGECVPEGEVEPVCGDDVCEGDEDCDICAADCGVCPPVCGDDVCEGDETCDTCAADCDVCPDPVSTIVCTLTDDGLEMQIFGPFLLMSTLPGVPVGVYAGCDNRGGWSFPYGDEDSRPWAEWEGWDASYTLVFPAVAEGIGLVLLDATGHEAWFDTETSATASHMAVTGDCELRGGKIYPLE